MAEVTEALFAEVVSAFHRGDAHPIRISWTIPNEELLDWRARARAIQQGKSVAYALHGWWLLNCLDLALHDAVAGQVSLDISDDGRPHFYGLVIVPTAVTPQVLYRRWADLTEAHDGPEPWKRTCTVRHWQDLLDYDAGIVTEGGEARRQELLSWVRDQVEGVVNYTFKGRDRSSWHRRFPTDVPDAMRSLPAAEWMVWSRKVSVLGYFDYEGMLERGASFDEVDALVEAAPTIDLAVALEARNTSLTSEQRAEITKLAHLDAVRRDRNCFACGAQLAPVRASQLEPRAARLHQPRRDQMHCPSSRCRTKGNRAHREVLSTIGRLSRLGQLALPLPTGTGLSPAAKPVSPGA